MQGRVGVITGAESDLGQAVARALAAEGMSLMLIAQPGQQVRALAEELTDTPAVRCFPAALDVADPDAVDRIVMHAEQHLGTIDLLLNLVPGRLTDALVPTMQQRGRGLVVNAGSAPDVDPAPTVTVANVRTADPARIVEEIVNAQ